MGVNRFSRCPICFFPRKRFRCTPKRCRGPRPAGPAEMKMRKRTAQAHKELEERIRQRLKANAQKPLDIMQWQELERQSHSNKQRGLIIRLQALEWLRLESLCRSYSLRELAIYETSPEFRPPEYHTVKTRDHDRLLTIHPIKFWPYSFWRFAALLADSSVKVVPGLDMSIKGSKEPASSLVVTASLPQFDWVYFSPTRVLLSFDPSQPKKRLLKDIQREVDHQIKKARSQQHRQRRHGAGRRIPLDRLAEALWAHDLKRWDDAKNIVIGAGAQSFGGLSPNGRQRENRSAQLLRLAARMIRIARQQESEYWFRKFR
jgi:hypothetical protein